MYLSGQPLHVITMTLTDEFRRRVGPRVPISFSAGIDKHNFPLAVACGFVPVTISTDLLRPGGYGRLPAYLANLTRQMRERGVQTIDQYILSFADGGTSDAGLRNTARVAEMARNDPRYHADANGGIPKRIDSQLTIFDCITCDKCLPVCPNAANFVYSTPPAAFDYRDIIVSPDGAWRDAPETRRFEITSEFQIACYADFCNECGNCDTFCPEYGGPYIEKPSFYGSMESFDRAAPRDGFVVSRLHAGGRIAGRIHGSRYDLTLDERIRLRDAVVEVEFRADDDTISGVTLLRPITHEHRVDMWIYHTLRHLYRGLLDTSRINQVNAAYANQDK